MVPVSYVTGHEHAQHLAEAFAAGCGGSLRHVHDWQPGPFFVHGLLRGGWWLRERALADGVDWFFGDNPYFRVPDRQYYRVTRNALQHYGAGEAGLERWLRLGLELQPWRQSGEHIVVIPPPRILGFMLAFDADAWRDSVVAELRQFTDRRIVVRDRMSWAALKTMHLKPPLSHDLKGAWALVAQVSNAAVEAVLAGIPVFCTNPCGAFTMGTSQLSRIEEPVLYDDAARLQWAANLAANQWTLDEIAAGQCWEAIGWR